GANDRRAHLTAHRLKPIRQFGYFAFFSLRNGHRKTPLAITMMRCGTLGFAAPVAKPRPGAAFSTALQREDACQRPRGIFQNPHHSWFPAHYFRATSV